MVASVERIKSLSAEDLENLYFSILQEPNTFRALGLVKLHNARKNLEIIKPTEVVADSEKQEIEALKNKFEDLMVSDDFERVLYNLASDYEDKVYKVKNLNLRIKNNKPTSQALVVLAFNLEKVLNKYTKNPLEFSSKYNVKDLSEKEITLARRLISAREILPIGSEYFGGEQKDFLHLTNYNINKYMGEYCERNFNAVTEISSWGDQDFKEGLEIVYSISENAEILSYIKFWEGNARTNRENINEQTEKFLRRVRRGNTLVFKKYQRLGKKIETKVVYFGKLVLQIQELISMYGTKTENFCNLITQQQLDSISEQSYWEIQQLKASEENPEIISLYNRRLVELVDVGVKDATDFVLEAPKLQKMYIEKDYEGFFWTLNNITGIEFVNSDGVNPNGNRVLEFLKTQSFDCGLQSQKIERKIDLEIPISIKEAVDRLKNSGNSVEVESVQKFDEIILEIEKAGGVSQFWFNSISGGNILSHKIHHGKNKDGFNFLGCALISLAGPYRVAIDRKTNAVIFVGNYHLG